MSFVSSYERSLDEKNRLQIPAEFRSQIDTSLPGQPLVLCPGDRPTTLSLYPTRSWEAMVERLRAREIDDEEAIEFEQWLLARSCRLDMDAQGRVVLPRPQLEDANMGKEITLAGANHRIDIWRTEEFREFIGAQRDWPNRKKFLRMLGSGWKDPNPSSTA